MNIITNFASRVWSIFVGGECFFSITFEGSRARIGSDVLETAFYFCAISLCAQVSLTGPNGIGLDCWQNFPR